MININYQRLGFWNGSLAGLVAFLCSAALVGLFFYVDSVVPRSGMHDVVDEYVSPPLLVTIAFVLFVALPVFVLVFHRRIACAIGMLLVVVPTTFYGYFFWVGAGLSHVKCLGSCG